MQPADGQQRTQHGEMSTNIEQESTTMDNTRFAQAVGEKTDLFSLTEALLVCLVARYLELATPGDFDAALTKYPQISQAYDLLEQMRGVYALIYRSHGYSGKSVKEQAGTFQLVFTAVMHKAIEFEGFYRRQGHLPLVVRTPIMHAFQVMGVYAMQLVGRCQIAQDRPPRILNRAGWEDFLAFSEHDVSFPLAQMQSDVIEALDAMPHIYTRLEEHGVDVKHVLAKLQAE